MTSATDRTYKMYYSKKKKSVKISYDYTDVSRFMIPMGAIEIERRDAYQQFKWSYSGGVYAGKGGYGHSDRSF